MYYLLKPSYYLAAPPGTLAFFIAGLVLAGYAIVTPVSSGARVLFGVAIFFWVGVFWWYQTWAAISHALPIPTAFRILATHTVGAITRSPVEVGLGLVAFIVGWTIR